MQEVTRHGYVVPLAGDAWPFLSRQQSQRLNRLVRRLPLACGGRARQQLKQMLGVPVRLRTLDVRVVSRRELGSIPLAVEARWQPPHYVGAAHIELSIEARLALCLLDRLLGGAAGESIGRPLSPLSDLECGVLAYALARAASSMSEWPWQLCDVAAQRPETTGVSLDETVIVWSMQVSLGDDAGLVRLVVPEALQAALRLEPPTQEAMRFLASLPTTVVLDAGRALLRTADLANLGCGDDVIPDELWWVPPEWPAEATRRLCLRPLSGRRASWWCSVDDALRLDTIESFGIASLETVTSMDTKDLSRVDWPAAMAWMGDAPIELAVEVARWSMPLEELAALRPGQILRTGSALATQVRLRAGDKVVATGELVNVEGEIGVRLTEVGGS